MPEFDLNVFIQLYYDTIMFQKAFQYWYRIYIQEDELSFIDNSISQLRVQRMIQLAE